MHVLVLSPAWRPHRVVGAARALGLLAAGKAEVVTPSEAVLRSARAAHRVPSVIVLRVRLPARVYRVEAAWSRRGVLERDGYRCAYCGAPANTVDHVQPRYRWPSPAQANTWLNTVAACTACNARKGGLAPTEAGMRFRPGYRLMRPRLRPEWMRHLAVRPEWAAYLDDESGQAAG
jgi:5-methylcytosine-specific restriction endonuclease McrA